ncbi:MAG: MBL fold metallo-hydrolase [Candidatus Omnitrophota bacterium]
MIFETVVVGPMQVNCYILAFEQDSAALIIDPGDQCRKIREVLDRHKLKPGLVINTHGHYDHIGCDDKFGVPVYIHAKDAALLKDPGLNLSSMFSLGYSVKNKIIEVKDSQKLTLNGITLKVLHTPGHTPGGISLLLEKPENKIVFTGDTLFLRGIGRSDLAGGSQEQLLGSIKEKLLNLSDDTLVYPGHGPSSTIGEERKNNPFLA